MKVVLVGAELEENLGIRYMASSLEQANHEVRIIPFNEYYDIASTVEQINGFQPDITGLSMVFTSRSREFCKLAENLRSSGYKGHIIAGGPFASFNAESLLRDFQSFNSICLTEGEKVIVDLADNLNNIPEVADICYRDLSSKIVRTSNRRKLDELDNLPFPKRTTFHKYFGFPIASILTSRGCWRNCTFCSINAWYAQCGNKKFRIRNVSNIVKEMKQLYFDYGVRIFNFQDDNFFLPSPAMAFDRFSDLYKQLEDEGIRNIAIAVKARPDSITRESISILDRMGIFRVFLGVENASENGLRNLNRKCTIEQILNALDILNSYDIHVAYNLLMFEPETSMEDILINLRFLEKHIENPQNFCRAEAHAGTGLEKKLLAEGLLLGDYFGLDYRIKDPKAETFHEICNYAFMDRNFNNSGLHYFNMQVDFYYQLLRRLYPKVLDLTLRSLVKNFIKRTNMETYHLLTNIYDFVDNLKSIRSEKVQEFKILMRNKVDFNSSELRPIGENIIEMLESAFANRNRPGKKYNDNESPWLFRNKYSASKKELNIRDILSITTEPIPYNKFKEMF